MCVLAGWCVCLCVLLSVTAMNRVTRSFGCYVEFGRAPGYFAVLFGISKKGIGPASSTV